MARLYFPSTDTSTDPFYQTLHQTLKALLNMIDGKDINVGSKRKSEIAENYKRKDIEGKDGRIYVIHSYTANGVFYTGLHLSAKRSRIRSWGSRGLDCRHIITVDSNSGYTKANYTDAKIEAILGEVVQEVRDCEGDEVLATMIVG